MQKQPVLDVKKIVKPILTNYNEHVLQLVRLLDKISFSLVYVGPSDIRDHIRDKTVYACSIKNCNTSKTKIIKSIFPVMIGSRLDTCIRKFRFTTFNETNLQSDGDGLSFETADIAVTLFIINGCVKQLPYLFTNDPTNCHIVMNSIVCCYTYDSQDRGKKLSFYVDNYDKYKRGDQIVSLNDGTENDDVDSFFDHCPYRVRQDVYFAKIFREGNFDIDHLANKIIVSPGHLFLKLFLKYLYQPLREKNWSAVKSKATMVVKSIESGTLLHVLSRKTIYHKEPKSTAKMVQTPSENHRELGMNGEVYVEKNSGCYREVKMQTYPLIPYMSHLLVRQISNKVRAVIPYHTSYVGFFCYLGLLEMKNIGRTQSMVKHSFVSTQDDLSQVYQLLPLDYDPEGKYYVVVNEACIPVTEKSFQAIELKNLKENLQYVECYQDKCFIYIRYKAGLIFKRLKHIWVTARDEFYWAQREFGLSCKDDIIVRFGFEYLLGHLVDLNVFFNHNMFAKNLLGFNALKNAILATDKTYSQYFMETLTAYCKVTAQHKEVCLPVDEFSKHFVLRLPRLTVGYMSLDGNNQEDCIAVREGLDAFDCYRFYTVRIKFEVDKKKKAKIVFYPVRGQSEDDYLGQVVCHGSSKLKSIPLSIYIRVVPVNDSQVKLYFTKSNFQIVQYILTKDRLIISMEQFHPSGMGDKLCSFHGQKGVLRKTTNMPVFDETVVPDLLINPYCITTRLTAGQIKEDWQECRDAQTVRNNDGKLLPGASAMYGKVYYFPIAYLSSEHIYAPTKCNIDKILGQAVKGRSRGGGMRLGNMEILNGMRGNGLASCFEEKVLEHGDRIFLNDIVIPKSVHLCSEDAKAYKYNMLYNAEYFLSEECTICLERGADYRTLCCKHSFHTICLKVWTDETKSCPSCFKEISYVDPFLSIT